MYSRPTDIKICFTIIGIAYIKYVYKNMDPPFPLVMIVLYKFWIFLEFIIIPFREFLNWQPVYPSVE